MLFDMTLNWQTIGISLAGGYLLGSIPFGLIFSWLAGAGDVRKIGSGSIGATNVLRTGNKAAAALTLLFDALKGAAAVLIAKHFWGADAALFAGLGAFLGHLFPVWLRFKGGAASRCRSASCWRSIGWWHCRAWRAGPQCWRCSAFPRCLRWSRLSSHRSIWLCSTAHETMLAVVLAVLVFIIHHENIRRLLRGEEPRVGAKSVAS